jgi:transposase
MVTCKETRAVIIALHKKGFTDKDVAARKIAPKSTIYRIIKKRRSLPTEDKMSATISPVSCQMT